MKENPVTLLQASEQPAEAVHYRSLGCSGVGHEPYVPHREAARFHQEAGHVSHVVHAPVQGRSRIGIDSNQQGSVHRNAPLPDFDCVTGVWI
jgi:hypothetical protein